MDGIEYRELKNTKEMLPVPTVIKTKIFIETEYSTKNKYPRYVIPPHSNARVGRVRWSRTLLTRFGVRDLHDDDLSTIRLVHG